MNRSEHIGPFTAIKVNGVLKQWDTVTTTPPVDLEHGCTSPQRTRSVSLTVGDHIDLYHDGELTESGVITPDGTLLPSKATNLIGVTQAATLMGVHPHTLRHWSDKGLISCVKTPSGRKYVQGDIDTFIAQDKVRRTRKGD